MDETTEGMRKALANAHGLYSIQGRRERAMRAYHRQTCCTLCCQPRFWLGDVPRKYHMRRKVHLVLTNSRLGTTWDVLQTIASVVACAFYVLSTYRVGHQLDADKVLTLFFAIDYVIRWYSARSRCWYPFGGMAIIDLITIVPTLIEWISGRSYEGFHFLRFARVLRIMRILRAFKVVNNSFDPVSRQITKLVITIASIVFLTAGLIHLVENEWDVTRSDPVVTFGDSLYFIVVTISTVGYGDISPDGTEGKIVVAVMIVVVIVFVPMQVGELTNLLAARSPFTARVSAGATPHALLIGNLSNVNVVRDFMSEFWHPDRLAMRQDEDNGALQQRNVIIIEPDEPKPDMLELLRRQNFDGRLRYYQYVLRRVVDAPRLLTPVHRLRGSIMREEDLMDGGAVHADSCFILSDPNADDVEAADKQTILRTLAVMNFNPALKTYVHLLDGRHKTMVSKARVAGMVCVNEMTMQLLAGSALAPGFSTLFINLMRSITTSTVAPSQRVAEFKHGCGLEVYTCRVPSELVGRLFSEVALLIYRRFKGMVLVWGVLDEHSTLQERRVLLNPARGLRLGKLDTLYVTAEEKDLARDVCSEGYAPFLERLQPMAVRGDVRVRSPATTAMPATPAAAKPILHVDVPSNGAGAGAGAGIVRPSPLATTAASAAAPAAASAVPHMNLSTPGLAAPALQPHHAVYHRAKALHARAFVKPLDAVGIQQRIVEDARHLRNHVIVCGCFRDVALVLQSLRSTSVRRLGLSRPVLLIVEPGGSGRRALVEARLPPVEELYVLEGNPTHVEDLYRANLHAASCCMLLPHPHRRDVIDAESLDSDTIFAYLVLEEYLAAYARDPATTHAQMHSSFGCTADGGAGGTGHGFGGDAGHRPFIMANLSSVSNMSVLDASIRLAHAVNQDVHSYGSLRVLNTTGASGATAVAGKGDPLSPAANSISVSAARHRRPHRHDVPRSLSQAMRVQDQKRERMRRERYQQLERAARHKREEEMEAFSRVESGVNTPFYAAGQGFVSGSLHTMLCQAFYDPALVLFAGALLSPRDDNCSMLLSTLVHDDRDGELTFGDAYEELLLRRDLVAVGIYRCVDVALLDAEDEEWNALEHPKGHVTPLSLDDISGYVFTGPPPFTPLRTGDRLFVLAPIDGTYPAGFFDFNATASGLRAQQLKSTFVFTPRADDAGSDDGGASDGEGRGGGGRAAEAAAVATTARDVDIELVESTSRAVAEAAQAEIV